MKLVRQTANIDASGDLQTSFADSASVSAVIPVFNEFGGSLERTLQGLLLQNRRPDRLLVIDDASPRPATIPVRLGSDVDVVRLPENGGLARARNRGARLTSSKYLLFVNCDVVLKPDWLERGIAFMESHLDAGAVSGRIVPVVGPKVLRDWRLQFIEPKVHRSVVHSPLPVTWLVGHVFLVRREVFDEIGGFDPRFRSAGEDWDFSQRMRSRGHAVVHLPALVAESHESTSIDSLARKSVRNAGWDLRPQFPGRACAATGPIRPFAATASIIRIFIDRAARNLVKRRLRFVPVDLAIAARSLALVWSARHTTPQ